MRRNVTQRLIVNHVARICHQFLPYHANSRGNDRCKTVSGLNPEGDFISGLRISLPYLPLEMFDIQGVRKTPCYLLRLMVALDRYKPLRTKSLEEKTTSYILSTRINVKQSLYASQGLKYPLVLEYKNNYVKRSSRRFTVQLIEADQTRPLSEATWVSVNVDPTTKRPTPFPEWWKRKYNIPSDGPMLEIQTPVKPFSGVITNQSTVRFTDVDSNEHANYITYVHMCLDAFYENIAEEKYSNGSKVFLNGWLNSATIVFKSDSLLGDVLTIESWQDVQTRNSFHFEISNTNKVAVLLTFRFYSSLGENSNL